jgi:cytochrome P450
VTDQRSDPAVDLFDPRTYERGIPYEAFARLRRDEPVSWHPEPAILGWSEGPGFWAVTRYDDVAEVSRKFRVFSAHRGATQLRDPDDPEDLAFIQQMMLNMDPPAQTRLRKLVNTGFTPRGMARMEPIVRRLATQVVDGVAAAGHCDFAEDIGADFPLLTLCAVMGVPPEDRQLIYGWTNRVIGFQDDELAEPLIDPGTGRPLNPRSPKALEDMFAYAHDLAERKRSEDGEDLLSVLLGADVEGERLTDGEFEMMFFLFSVAGNDTTHSAVPGGMLALLENPDQLAWLLEDLDGRLDTAVEELLRFAPPVIHFRRTAVVDTELSGARIREGDKVVIFYPAANRDPEVFDDPERLRLDRHPNRHLTFGVGAHFCLGNSFARIQIRALLREVLTRMPDLRLGGPVERLRSNFINGIKRMPVAFTPERAPVHGNGAS